MGIQEDVNTYKTSIEGKDSQIADFKESKILLQNKLSKLLNKAEKDTDNYKQEKKALQKSLQGYEEEIDDKCREISELKNSNIELQKKIDELDAEQKNMIADHAKEVSEIMFLQRKSVASHSAPTEVKDIMVEMPAQKSDGELSQTSEA